MDALVGSVKTTDSLEKLKEKLANTKEYTGDLRCLWVPWE